ncbi:MAG TPA: divalent-cation tolerance protein CutA [Luteimonas sp.]|nr:divalent-cation tolerance protein CutA [Luteimonas sp.]
MPLPTLVCLSTCPDPETADRIAAALVEERLAACVNALPGVRSTYRWKGDVQRDNETLLIIKTTKDRLERLAERLAELHPYELPELVAVEAAGGLPAYLDWIAAQTRAEER